MSLLLLFRPSTTTIVPGPVVPGPTLSWREPSAVNYSETATTVYREPAVRTAA